MLLSNQALACASIDVQTAAVNFAGPAPSALELSNGLEVVIGQSLSPSCRLNAKRPSRHSRRRPLDLKGAELGRARKAGQAMPSPWR